MWKTALATVLLVILSVAIGAGGTYVYLNKKHVDEKNDLNAQIASIQSQIGTEKTKTTKSIEDAVALTMNTYNTDKEATFEITEIDGNYASGGTGSGGGGTGWYAVKENGTWKEVIQTQDTVTCADTDKYAFPKTMIPTCVDTSMQEVTR